MCVSVCFLSVYYMCVFIYVFIFNFLFHLLNTDQFGSEILLVHTEI